MRKIILSFFLILFFSQSFAQIKYDLFVDIKDHILKGKIKIVSDKDQTITLYTKSLNLKNYKSSPFITINLRKDKPFSLEYSFIPENNTKNFINDRFIYLTENWYPVPDKYVIYNFEALLPEGFKAISEAEKIIKVKNKNHVLFRFMFPHPIIDIHLIASKDFVIKKDKYRNISLEVYFFKEDKKYIDLYLNKLKDYLQEYEKILTKFPYKRFAVVENLFQTGYSMPTFTLIGNRLVKYSFILNQSLRHELMHQWFGNYVFINYEGGNWAEGLTTYLSDYRFYEKEGRGWEYRKNILLKYKAYVNSSNEYPVSKFRYKKDSVSEAIGYGKVLFIFHMLKNLIGEDAFYEGLRQIIKQFAFKELSWKDIENIYTKISKQKLDWFFNQWVYSTTKPEIDIENTSVLVENGKFKLSFKLKQKNKELKLKIPVFIETTFGEEKKFIQLSTKEKNITLFLEDEPLKVIVDKNYDVFRKLKKEENIPIIADILGEKDLVIIVDKKNREKYKNLIEFLSIDKNIKITALEKADKKDLKKSLIILDKSNPFVKKYFAGISLEEDGLSINTYENPFNYKKVACLINASSKKEVERNTYKIKHYGLSSFIHIKNGHLVKEGQLYSDKGIIKAVRNLTKGIPVRKTVDIKQLISTLNGEKIIYVGEQHTKFSHHIVQLNIIKGLYKKHKKLAIGMEMFQRKFQPVIDKYINGEISEKQFLKETEYFKRWGFDYNLYKPIIDFARKNKIPVVALNIETEILKKVSKNGIESLSEKEREKLPKQMDFSNIKYRNILKKIFNMHKTNKDFEHFFQSQILWDETMAESIDKFLRKNKEYIMVVIAGNGHLKYGFGIPDRCFRRNGFSYKIILNDEEIDKDIGDYILYPEELKGKQSIKLGVYLQETENGLKVLDVVKNSIAAKLKLKKNDIIVKVNGTKIKNIYDLKVELFFLKKGQKLKLKVLRNGKYLLLETKV